MNKYNERNQAVLMRDMIDMYREYNSDPSAIEYLSSFAFNIARIIEENNIDDKRLSWDSFFSFLDQRYNTLNKNSSASTVDESKVDELYNNAVNIISNFPSSKPDGYSLE